MKLELINSVDHIVRCYLNETSGLRTWIVGNTVFDDNGC